MKVSFKTSRAVALSSGLFIAAATSACVPDRAYGQPSRDLDKATTLIAQLADSLTVNAAHDCLTLFAMEHPRPVDRAQENHDLDDVTALPLPSFSKSGELVCTHFINPEMVVFKVGDAQSPLWAVHSGLDQVTVQFRGGMLDMGEAQYTKQGGFEKVTPVGFFKELGPDARANLLKVLRAVAAPQFSLQVD